MAFCTNCGAAEQIGKFCTVCGNALESRRAQGVDLADADSTGTSSASPQEVDSDQRQSSSVGPLPVGNAGQVGSSARRFWGSWKGLVAGICIAGLAAGGVAVALNLNASGSGENQGSAEDRLAWKSRVSECGTPPAGMSVTRATDDGLLELSVKRQKSQDSYPQEFINYLGCLGHTVMQVDSLNFPALLPECSVKGIKCDWTYIYWDHGDTSTAVLNVDVSSAAGDKVLFGFTPTEYYSTEPKP